ncbi:hypothetical protein EJ07DRAFT_83188, partial [Lizonia empirigonia]
CDKHKGSCLEDQTIWDEDRKNKLAKLYACAKAQMWGAIATEMGVSWRLVESMHWRLGEQEMSARADV